MLDDDTVRREKSISIKGKLKCIFSRRGAQDPPSTREWRTKSADARGSGHQEERRVMCILHSLEMIGRHSKSSHSLSQLYVKPLPYYLQAKLRPPSPIRQRPDNRPKPPERPVSPTPQGNYNRIVPVERPVSPTHQRNYNILLSQQAAQHAKTETSSEKILLPSPQPLTTSKWHQKMLNKLDTGTNNERVSSPPDARPTPVLNRQLQVQGQSSNCCLRQPSALSRYKPTFSRAPRPPTFTFADPLPDDVPAICNKEGGLSLFEQRIIQLEKMERESITLERQSKPRLSKNESTTRIPMSLMQPKYLDSTLAFQSKASPRKQSLTQVVTKSRSQTPSNNRTKENEVNKRVVKTNKVEKPKYFKPPKAAVTENTQIRRKNNRRPSSTKVS